MSEHDVQAVRALAHPLRLRLLDLLRFEGPSTATRLAERLGESSGATSYHLRQLARHGFLEEVPRQGRERWWRYQERPVTLPHEGDERRLLAELLSREAYALDRYMAVRERYPEWDAAAFFRSRALRLTARELDQLRRDVDGLLEAYAPADAPDPPADAMPVRVLTFAFPLPSEER